MLHRLWMLALCAALAASVLAAAPAAADVDPVYEMVFIHHSSGRYWIEDDLGPAIAGLDWVELHSAGYLEPYQMDAIARDTDVCQWLAKFSGSLNLVFTFDHSTNVYYGDDRENDIVLFKSCFTASDLVAVGQAPGDPDDCAKTVWNYRAAFTALAAIFAQHPDRLFIPMTTLPRSYWDGETDPAANMELTRLFNRWLKDDFVRAYENATGLHNLAVFDAFDVLAYGPAGALPDYLRAEFIDSGWGGSNSHPDADGNHALTYGYTDPDEGRTIEGFLAFLPRAVEAWKNPQPSGTLSAELECLPSQGTLPFTSTISVRLTNLYPGQLRRFASAVHLALAAGGLIHNWRSGYTNIGPEETKVIAWNQLLPGRGNLLGENVFLVHGQDVTPSPYNQPPYPASGDTDGAACTVTCVIP